MSRLLKLLTSSILIAFIVVTGVFIADQYRVDKHDSVLLDSEWLLFGQRIYYNDFDHDGISENVRLGYNGHSGIPFVMVTDVRKGVIAHWDFIEEWIARSDMILGDCDNNGYDEMYLFTMIGDTIFINGYEPNTKRIIVHKKLVDIAGRYEGIHDFDIITGGIVDLDCDGYNEVVFFINAGFSVYPRNLYIYSPIKDIISKSPLSGAQVPTFPMLIDLDGDCDKEILLQTYAPGNIADIDYPYRDSSGWVMALDHHNHFLFDPIEFYGHTTSVWLAPCIMQDEKAIIALTNVGSSITSPKCELISYNLQGEQQKLLKFNFGDRKKRIRGLFYRVKGDYTEPLFLDADNCLWQVDAGLNLARIGRISAEIRNYYRSHFIPHGVFLFVGLDHQSFYLYRDNFRHPYRFSVPNDGGHFTFSVVKRGTEQDAWSIQIGKQWCLFTTKLNPYYYWRFAWYTFLFIIIYFIIYLIKKVQRDHLTKRYQNEKEVLNLQMRALKNQIDPHFTLNVLNSIWSLFYDQQEKADRYFAKYARLIRQTLSDSGKTRVTLEEELAFVENYLTLEKFRFDDSFDYSIDVGEELMQVMIPRMLLHTFVENSLKHGLRPLPGKGHLHVTAKNRKGYEEILVEDNGVGREQASKSNLQSTGKGLGIIERMLDIYDQLYRVRITYEITDLKDHEGNPAGTIVFIRIPVQ